MARIGRRINLSLIFAAFVILVMVGGVFAQTTSTLTPPGSVKQYSWNPAVGGAYPAWTNGNNTGYMEGETAVMAAEISKEAGKTYDLPICLQVWEAPLPVKAYAFTSFEPFDTTTRAPNLPPAAFPGGEPIDYTFGPGWDVSKPPVYGFNITINSVTPQTLGLAAGCSANEIGVTVNYTPLTDSGAYLVWGGHIALPGDVLPAGTEAITGDAVVPQGKSAGYVLGNFQARLKTAAADKTLPFKVETVNAVGLSAFGATATTASAAAAPALAGFAAMAGLAAAGFARRRRG